MSKYLVLPLFSMVLLTFMIAVVLLRSRIKAVKSGQTDMRHFRTYTEGTPTEAMLKASQHFTNLFELPVLFYAGCLAAMLLQVEGVAIHIWAWLFVSSRIIHAYIHVGSNRVRQRMKAYLFGWVAVMAIWLLVVIQVMRS